MTNISLGSKFLRKFRINRSRGKHRGFVSGRGRGSHTSPTIDRVESCRLRDKRVSGL